MKKSILPIALILLAVCSTYGDEPGGRACAFLEMPATASQIATGGANLVFEPEPAAIFWNPANISSIRKVSAQGSAELLPLSAMRMSVAAAVPVWRLTFAAGYLGHSVGDINTYDVSGASTGTMSYSQSAICGAVAYGWQTKKNLPNCKFPICRYTVGASIKSLILSDGGNDGGSGYTVDLGASGRVQFATFGVMVRNITGSITYPGVDPVTLPKAIVIGGGIEFCESHWVELSVENKIADRLRWRLGGQYLVSNYAALRGGVDFSTGTPNPFDELRVALGGAFYYKLGALPLELSYSAQYINAVGGLGFSTALSWNTY
jgi:hypothetical protein